MICKNMQGMCVFNNDIATVTCVRGHRHDKGKILPIVSIYMYVNTTILMLSQFYNQNSFQ